ncbi:hypothetical protein IW261DRAFT_1319861, partial [Armillaria novae-zelandiae]
EWTKKVEDAMRGWIVTEDCERDYSDVYFDNPPHQTAPNGPCCDRCTAREIASTPCTVNSATDRPVTPDFSELVDTGSAHSSPTKHVNSNGKRRMNTCHSGPATRRGDYLANVREALICWRLCTIKQLSPAPFTAAALLPDHVLTKLASNARLQTIADLQALSPPWIWAEKYGSEVLRL